MDEQPSPKGSEWLQKLANAGQILTAASIYGSGLLGILVVEGVGPYLAMGFQMHGGNTEPSHPELPWPLGLCLILGLLPVPALATQRWFLCILASVPFALLPWWQLYQMTKLAGQ